MVFVSCLAERLVLNIPHILAIWVLYILWTHHSFPVNFRAKKWEDAGYMGVFLLVCLATLFSINYHATGGFDSCPALVSPYYAGIFHGMDLTTAFNYLPILLQAVVHPAPSLLRDLLLAWNILFFAGLNWFLHSHESILFLVYVIYMAMYSFLLIRIYFRMKGIGLSWYGFRRNTFWSKVVIVFAAVPGIGFFMETNYWIWHSVWHVSSVIELVIVYTKVWERDESVAINYPTPTELLPLTDPQARPSG